MEHGFAVEYSPNPRAFDRLPTHIDPFLEAGVAVRYHGFFPRHEFGHADAATAERAVHAHLSALEAMQGRGEQVITFHIGLNPTWASPSVWRICAGVLPAILRPSSSGRVNPAL